MPAPRPSRAVRRRPACLAYRVRITGHVQGVGFRPFVLRLAEELTLTGGVGNDSAGVFVEIQGEGASVDTFLRRLRTDAPDAARIETIHTERIEPGERQGFVVWSCPSPAPGPVLARVPTDCATCPDCLAEIAEPHDRRRGYPFTTCTACGPRYTLLAAMPYERGATAMDGFPLCAECAAEFGDASDRRFHAEVMACPCCGPQIAFEHFDSPGRCTGSAALRGAADVLRRGGILALKGLGGYQLLTRADDAEAIGRLRARKRRPTKPLAILVRSLAEAEKLAHLTTAERELLASPQNPIVLVRRREGCGLSPAVAPHSIDVGLFLPTTPLHHLLLAEVGFPVVATSGNPGEEPILADDALRADLAALADASLSHDRPIVRRLDDSVVHVVAGRPSTLRLARGLAPLPLLALERWLARPGRRAPAGGLLALGGQQKNAIALWTGAQAILGPHLGDLDHPRTRSAWRLHIEQLRELYGMPLRALVGDLHPDYTATRWAQESRLPFLAVPHHHAHAAAALVEHDLLDETVLALTWDGTGLGPDGTLSGGECLRASLRDCRRIASLRPLPLAGGESAIRQPWRIGAALLRESLGEIPSDSPWAEVSAAGLRDMMHVLERDVCCPRTTSLGRLFDGVASLLLGVSHVTYEGEAAAALEASADRSVEDAYPVVFRRDPELSSWDWRPLVRDLVADRRRGTAPGVCAARFHNSIARWAGEVARTCTDENVVLSGGCFQNRLLCERVATALEASGKRVHLPGTIPVNDGGLAAGQLALALAAQDHAAVSPSRNQR